MHRLAKLGFTQSYTYFTWRNTQARADRVLHRAAHGPGARVLPPQRLAEHARHPARVPADRRPRRVHGARWCWPRRWRRTTASTARPSSCCEHAPREPGSEEYLDSEKYQLRHWDLERADSLAPFIARRQPHPPRATRRCSATGACASSRSTTTQLHLLSQDDRRRRRCGRRRWSTSTRINAQSGWVELPLERLGARRPTRPTRCTTCSTGAALPLARPAQLRAARSARASPAHVFVVRRHVRTERDFDYFL